ncbi:acyltransferase family protein [Undibacterium sp. Tian12W]|uniref:acyltransferase family protein n=1 Tax=Undibacterium sp. Tian12W TaxID=3413054 RepID=UPI003BF32CC2
MITSNNAAASERFLYIDFLRGLAAMLVIYQHTIEVAAKVPPELILNLAESAIANFFTKQIGIGEIGVCIFLMVSGFVVPFSLSTYHVAPVKTFVIHRFFRLYPAYWLSAILGLVFVYWRFGVSQGGKELDWTVFAINLTMFQAFFDVENIIGSYWTLSLELFFYLSCIYLFSFSKLNSLKSILLIMLLVMLLPRLVHRMADVSAYTANVLAYLRYTGYMFFGLLYREWLLDKNSTKAAKALLVLLLTYFQFVEREILTLDAIYLKTPVTQLIAIVIFVLMTSVLRVNVKLGNFLGKISYSMYLFHPVIFYPLYTYFWLILSPEWQAHPHLFFVLASLLTIPFSYCSYRWLEQPSIAFGKKFTLRRQQTRMPPTTNMKAQT